MTPQRALAVLLTVCDACTWADRGEAAIGVHTLPDALLRAHGYDPKKRPLWGYPAQAL